MQRDMDLARAIMLEIKKQPYTGGWLNIAVSGAAPEATDYHIMLLNEAGLIEAIEPQARSMRWQVVRLTWPGHEFLDAARDEKIWAGARSAMAKVGGFSMQLAVPLLVEMGKAKLREYGLLPP
jgi:DNA-binding transcriptional ArsR family regulator